ncbi:histone acetyltransferase (RNA polymerase elongator complex component) [Brassicibacter mesophilus]
MSIKRHIIPIFVPHTGCPHDCVFCNQKKITGSSTNITDKEVYRIINDYIRTIPKTNESLEVAFYGGSFTGIDIETQANLLDVAYSFKKQGYIDKIRLSTRPDYINKDILSNLKMYSVDTIELGVQSMDAYVLEQSFRGHSPKDVVDAAKLIKNFGFELGLQMMIGLPGDDKYKDLYTANKIIQLQPDFVRIYPTLVIKETFLAKQYLSGAYKALSLENAVSICTELLLLFNYYSINVIRIGLQPTDNIAMNKDILAGPFHSSFRQLVESNVYKIILNIFFMEKSISSNEISIILNRKEISNFVGQKSENLEYIKRVYGIPKIKVIGQDISSDCFYISFDDNRFKIEKKAYVSKYLKDRELLKGFH